MFTAPSAEQILQCPPSGQEQFMMMEMKTPWNKSHIEIAPNCPRCASSNTKFCYYNNYSLSQPRYFCKGCRRYWTKGGSLRNVPVGGGCRKNRRGKAARLSQADRGSLSYFQHHNSSTTTEDDLAGNTQSGGSNAPDIDLAVVFAKFLNHNSTTPDGHDHDPNLVISSSALNDRDGSHNSSKADDLVEAVGHHYLPEGHQSQEVNVQTFMGINHNDDMNIHEFELQGLLGDDEQVVQDVFWSNDAPTSLTSSTASFTWQPMMDLQELECSLPSDDDQLKMSTNLCGDNWSSLEFSGFEVFSPS